MHKAGDDVSRAQIDKAVVGTFFSLTVDAVPTRKDQNARGE